MLNRTIIARTMISFCRLVTQGICPRMLTGSLQEPMNIYGQTQGTGHSGGRWPRHQKPPAPTYKSASAWLYCIKAPNAPSAKSNPVAAQNPTRSKKSRLQIGARSNHLTTPITWGGVVTDHFLYSLSLRHG
jgi:hypothetical protein